MAVRAAQVEAKVAYSGVPLDAGEAIRVHGDARMPTASTFKVYLLAALYAAAGRTKSGSMPGVRADVGIVETRKRSWAMAVQIRGAPDFNTGDNHPFNDVIADLSKLVFDAWGG
jgi:beta-lactamase class A